MASRSRVYNHLVIKPLKQYYIMAEKIEPGKYVEIAYDLYTLDGEGHESLRHQVPASNPEKIVYGITPGVIVPLAEAIKGLEKGDTFEVTVTPEQGFGEYNDQMLRAEELPRNIFESDGKLDEEQIHAGAHIYLQTNIGQEVPATVVEVTDSTVKVMVDFNHPLAGQTVIIKGKIVLVRPATAEEIAINQQQGCGCGGNCGEGCGEGCGCGDNCGGCGN